MKVILSIFMAAVVLFIQSCDPGRVLIVKSANKPNSFVEIYANQYFRSGAEGYGKENKQVLIRIPTDEIPVRRDTAFYFGFGGWGGDESMRNFSKKIDSIIISNSNSKIILNDQEEINSYLLKHRRGLFVKQVLIIKAK